MYRVNGKHVKNSDNSYKGPSLDGKAVGKFPVQRELRPFERAYRIAPTSRTPPSRRAGPPPLPAGEEFFGALCEKAFFDAYDIVLAGEEFLEALCVALRRCTVKAPPLSKGRWIRAAETEGFATTAPLRPGPAGPPPLFAGVEFFGALREKAFFDAYDIVLAGEKFLGALCVALRRGTVKAPPLSKGRWIRAAETEGFGNDYGPLRPGPAGPLLRYEMKSTRLLSPTPSPESEDAPKP